MPLSFVLVFTPDVKFPLQIPPHYGLTILLVLLYESIHKELLVARFKPLFSSVPHVVRGLII
jgi:hypothetical protein